MTFKNSIKRRAEASGLRRGRYLATFDGWRAIAAIMVIVSHFCIYEFRANPYLNDRLGQWNFGSVGVNIFFGLSGFLITYLILEERESSGAFNLSKFWIRRVFRIVPLAWFYVATLSLGAIFGLHQILPKDVLPASLFYYNYFVALKGGFSPAVAHVWTLGVEMQFYLFWSLIIWMTGCRRVASLSLGCALMIIGWRWYLGHHGVEIHVWRTDFRADTLFMGAFFGAIYFCADGKLVLKKFLPPWSLLLVLPGLVFVIGWKPHGYLILEPLLGALLITGTLINKSHAAFRWMEWAPLTWLGRISFSVYIWQQLFTGAGSFHSDTFPENLLALPLSLIWILPVAWLSYRYIEAPGVRLGAWLIRRGEEAVRSGLLGRHAVISAEPS